MFQSLAEIWKQLSEDLLIFRVIVFNGGLLLLSIPVVAFATGTATEVNDGAFYIVLTVLLAGGAYLMHVAAFSSDQKFSSIGVAASAGNVEFWAVIALVTFSVPITLAIKWWRSRHS